MHGLVETKGQNPSELTSTPASILIFVSKFTYI